MKDFGKYKIKKQVGIGGTSSVYLAEHTGLDRDIILKVMSNTLLSNDIDYKKLFIEEAQIIAKLNHPNIVHVYDIHSSDEMTYIEMEYLSGGTLKERTNKSLSFDPIKIITEIASALQYVFNATGTIHRDVKPSNILFREKENELVAVLSDFGIAKTEDIDTEFTNIGVRVGTPRYMSPEQLMGGSVDQRSDLYSLGIILYEMLSGELFNRDTNPDATQNFKTPILPVGHKKLQPIINKLTSSNPASRYQNGDELISALIKFKNYKPLINDQNINPKADITNVLTSTMLKIKLREKPSPEKKQSYFIYAFALAINIAGGFYIYSNAAEKNIQQNTEVERLEVSLLSFQQNEIDVRTINEQFQVTSNKYPNDEKLKKIGNKIQRIGQKQRRRSLIDSTAKLIDDKEYILAEKQLSLALKLSPSEIELDEINLIKEVILKREKDEEREELKEKLKEKKRIKIEELNKSRLEAEAIAIAAKKENAKKESDDNQKSIKSVKESYKNEVNKKAEKGKLAGNNCHYHIVNNKGKLSRHCHPSANKKHVHKKDPWAHIHPAIRNCTRSISHTHRFKDKEHRHRYSCK